MSFPQYVDRREFRGKNSPVFGNPHNAIPALTTRDFDLNGTVVTALNQHSVLPHEGTLKNLKVNVSANASTGNTTIDVYVNNILRTLGFPLVIPTVSTGVFSAPSNFKVEVKAGDRVALRVLNNGGVGSITVDNWSLTFDPIPDL